MQALVQRNKIELQRRWFLTRLARGIRGLNPNWAILPRVRDFLWRGTAFFRVRLRGRPVGGYSTVAKPRIGRI